MEKLVSVGEVLQIAECDGRRLAAENLLGGLDVSVSRRARIRTLVTSLALTLSSDARTWSSGSAVLSRSCG